MDPQEYKRTSLPSPFGSRSAGYDRVPLAEQQTAYSGPGARQFSDDQGHLLADASTFGRAPSHERNLSRERDDIDHDHAHQHAGFAQDGYAQPPVQGGGGGAPWQPLQQQGKGGYAY